MLKSSSLARKPFSISCLWEHLRNLYIHNNLACFCVYMFLGETGPPHAREFTYVVTVRGWEFAGSGKTKKLAKAAAAERALQYLNDVVNVGPNATGVSFEMNNRTGQTVRSRAEEMGKREVWKQREKGVAGARGKEGKEG